MSLELGSSSEGGTFFIDGKEIACGGQTLFESFKNEDRHIDGFCFHPLLKKSKSCMLCQVYDEKAKQVVLSCQVVPENGARYSTHHEELHRAEKEVQGLYLKGHSFSCSRCSNQSECDLLDTFSQPLIQDVHRKRSANISLGDRLEVNFDQCINCSLCTDFEEQHSEVPSLKPSIAIPEVVGPLNHNYGVNLIDICPTGCFKLKDLVAGKTQKVQKDFCRGCDRLCEIEVLFEGQGDQFRPTRARAPQMASHWVCDEVNSPLRERLKISLTRSLEKTAEGWLPTESLNGDGVWHILAPANLPEELWSFLESWAKKNKDLSLEIYDWPERNKQMGLLRSSHSFQQESRERLLQIIPERSSSQKVQVCLIAPEWIGDLSTWQDILRKVQEYPKKVFLGPAINYELYDKMDVLFSIPSYELMTWKGRNYQNELHQKNGESITLDILK